MEIPKGVDPDEVEVVAEFCNGRGQPIVNVATLKTKTEKPKAKPAPKVETKVEPKVEKVETKPETKVEPKAETKVAE